MESKCFSAYLDINTIAGVVMVALEDTQNFHGIDNYYTSCVLVNVPQWHTRMDILLQINQVIFFTFETAGLVPFFARREH